jgi:hypothetical protein
MQQSGDKSDLLIQLERILTIDGKGRPAKAKLLLDLIEKTDKEVLVAAITQVSERKFF